MTGRIEWIVPCEWMLWAEVVVMVEEVLDSFFAEDLALIVDIVRYIYSNRI